ncbi:hypothetical protein C5Z25_09495 [Lactobacillus sp. CBA3605]|uniref:hypothetical protein n=1 Tax=Lactobacillus sp. CBA3605 TaxID=2099788 RepID=UPI000CFC6EB3|nr:hypothetical protein [Lactobacillus sp. CBA3605]AVK61991.1 hypothetical protein C5Z25_09495 [Lactobacillus sp. CBA3605]
MDYFQTEIKQWSDWQAVVTTSAVFEPLIRQIYSSEHEPFKTPVAVATDFCATFAVGPTQIAIFPPAVVAATTRDRYQAERFSLTRLARLQLMAPRLRHAGFIFDAYQFYYVIYQPLTGVTLTEFKATAEPLAKATLGQQLGAALLKLNTAVPQFNQVDHTEVEQLATWQPLGATFATERAQFLAQQTVQFDQFVHGELTGETIIVTADQVGFCHFQTAQVAPRQTELVPLLLAAAYQDPDLMAGLKKGLASPDLVTDLLIGLLWRADGPSWIRQVMGRETGITLAQVQAQLAITINGKAGAKG